MVIAIIDNINAENEEENRNPQDHFRMRTIRCGLNREVPEFH